jgi:plastocyanin
VLRTHSFPRHTFDVPGTYQYFCIPHEMAGMTGTVVVTG